MNKYLPKLIGALINFISIFSCQLARRLAIYIFSTPQKGKLNDKQINYLNSATKEFIYYNNTPIATYYWKGEKAPILLAHGWESNSYRWKDLIEQLKKLNHTIIAIDAPAHGNSGSKTFNALLYSKCIHVAAKKHKPHTIIGHSIGGTASTIAINNYNLPSVKNLISLGAPSNLNNIISNYIKLIGINPKVVTAMNRYYLNHFGQLPNFFTIANFSKNIKAKGLIIHDKKDKIIPFTDALDIKQHYPNSTLIETTGFGHGLKSEKIYNYIIEFLNN